MEGLKKKSVDDIINFFQKECCSYCTKVFSNDEKLSKDMCSQHFLCIRCRLFLFHNRSNTFCKCKAIYSDTNKQILAKKLEKVCIICFTKKEKYCQCNKCNKKICLDCRNGDSCYTCANKYCDVCNQLLDPYSIRLESGLVVHIGCKIR
jgi:hypothetical protein